MTAAAEQAAPEAQEPQSAPLITRDQVLAQFREFEERLAAADNMRGRVYDLDNPRENKAARSDRLALGKTIAELDRRHTAIKAPLLDATRMVDGERKRIKDALLEVQEGIKAQLDAHEQRERDRVEAIQVRIAEIRSLNDFGGFQPAATVVAERMESARAIVLDDSWQEFKADAALAKTETAEALDRLYAERAKAEAEEAELDRLRHEKEARERQEREERIAREAAEKARADAEAKAREEADRLERERQEAEQKAAQERAEAERKASEERERLERERAEEQAAAAKAIADAQARAERAAAEERARIEQEQAEQARKAEAERKADEARKAKQQHRAKIHAAAKSDLIAGGLDEATATTVVELIRDGKIAHVAIAY